MRYGNGIMRIRYLMRRNMKNVIPAVTFIAFMCGSCAMTRLYPLNEAFPEIRTYYNPKGSIEELFYKTEARPGYRRAIVYLPEGYRDDDVSYPVLYLMHGANGNETSWITKGMILREIDRLIMRGEMEKAIVVFPNMNQYDNEKDFAKSRQKNVPESFFEPDGSAERSLTDILVPLIDSKYRTIPEKKMRAIAGLSMGGMQAIHISASFPDMFGYVGMFSPFVTPFVKKGEYSDFYKNIRRKLKKQFEEPPELYWIMTGRMDFFRPHTDGFSQYLKEKGYRHRYDVSKGGHEWYNWVEYCNRFMKEIFR